MGFSIKKGKKGKKRKKWKKEKKKRRKKMRLNLKGERLKRVQGGTDWFLFWGGGWVGPGNFVSEGGQAMLKVV